MIHEKKKRQHRATSKEAHEFIKPLKQSLCEKIMLGLEKLPVGGNYEQIAEAAGIKPDQVWRRLSEMERDGKIYNTGVTRKLSSGINGIVWSCPKKEDNWFRDVYQQEKPTPTFQQLSLYENQYR